MNRRVVVTGMGVCSPLGHTIEDFSRALFAGRSAVHLLECRAGEGSLTVPAATVSLRPEDHFSKLELTTLDRFSQMALLAAREAMAGFSPEGLRERMGVYVGSGMGGAGHIEGIYQDLFLKGARRVRPVSVVNIMNNAAAAHLAIRYGLLGANATFSNACASSANGIGEALRAIRHGYLDAALAGGTEALLVYGAVHAWHALGVLAKPAPEVAASCRPFSADRSGLVLGEGAAMLLLEAEDAALRRGAPILGELVGYGVSCDASHLTKPDAAGQVRAMKQALADAGLAPGDIGHINAHATATLAGDVVETAAIREVFGQAAPPVSATKAMHGHLLGAAGALECVAAILALREQRLPPTINLDLPDPLCDLDYVPGACREARFDYALSNSFAFGGSNASLILGRR
ncbi:MAG: beta-ketoacyl-[acyl-carrier-protein] synthase family protein [Rhodocyclaceae bacterium]|nr:beta-ketoacyl-[acyl-carrier-protein] synthase family protein [Rhodocyclaceae bacterium]